MRWMPAYESMGWPTGQMGSFWAWLRGRSSWLDVGDIVRNVCGILNCQAKDNICIMFGSEDMMMDLEMCRRQAAEYRDGLRRLRDVKKTDSLPDEKPVSTSPIDGVTVEHAGGVRLVVVEEAGHHLQNDIQRDAGAEALLQFVQQT